MSATKIPQQPAFTGYGNVEAAAPMNLKFLEATEILVGLVLAAAQLHPISMEMSAPALTIRITKELAVLGLAEITVGTEIPTQLLLASWAAAHLDNYMVLAFLAYKVKGV